MPAGMQGSDKHKTKMAASQEAAIFFCITINYFASARPATWLTSVT